MKFLRVVIAVLLLSACTGEIHPPDAPDDLISRDSMVIVLRELVVIEAYLQNQYQQVGTFYKSMSRSGKHCLKKFHINPKRFERSYDYYVSRQDELQSIYSEVIDSLNKEVNELNIQKGQDTLPELVEPPQPGMQLPE
jgi:hypothetical protein